MNLAAEIRQASRGLRKSPGFTLIAVLTLALGIGANTAIFSALYSVLLRPLPYPHPDSIVALRTQFVREGRSIPRITGGDMVDLRGASRVLAATSYYYGGEMGVQVRGKAVFTGTWLVNAGFFRVFGVAPLRGRLFDDSEGVRAAVVSAAFAKRYFGDADRALGQTISFEKRVIEITGVMPDTLRFPDKAEIWIAAPFTPENLNRTAYNYRAVARLKPGVTAGAAARELERIGANLAAAYPATNREKTFTAVPLREEITGSMRSTMALLMAAVALVLLVACTNVANLLLARGTSRSHEMAIRAALGANRWSVVRLLLVESAMVAAAAGAVGVLLASWGVATLASLAPEHLPRMNEAAVTGPAFLFNLAVSAAAVLLFGLAPAWSASRTPLQDALKQGGSRGTIGGERGHLRHALVIAEIAAAMVLAVGAGLLGRSLTALVKVPLGFESEGMMVMYANAPAEKLDEYLRVSREFDRMYSELRTIPGVLGVAGAMGVPAGLYGSNGAYAVEGRHRFEPGAELPQAGFRLASPSYFRTMGVPLVAGRDFSERDQYDAPFVAIVSRSLAAQTFPHEDPIGHRIQCGLDSDKWMTVVGVVGDVRPSPGEAPGPELYMPLSQHPYFGNDVQIVVRTDGEPSLIAGAVRAKMQERAPSIATKITSMRTMLSDSVAAPRFRTLLVVSFAALALLLAMAGVYGVMTYTVAQRTAELGLRLALGAGVAGVFRAVLGRTMRLVAAGLAIGTAASLAAGRLLESLLFGVRSQDPTTYSVVVAAVALVALAAGAVPAWRATRIDPIIALRRE